jgi:ubiquinone biosynthesis protein COQ9
VSSLFGQGDDARRVLINAWMDDAVQTMRTVSSPSIRSVLRTRLERNEGVLEFLPEVCVECCWRCGCS